MADLRDDSTVEDILSKVSKRVEVKGKSVRALDVTGKDLALLRAIADPMYSVDAITNKLLQAVLTASLWANGLSDKKLSTRIIWHFRLFREHGLIKKLPNQHKYLLTAKERLLTTALNQFLGAKVSDLASLSLDFIVFYYRFPLCGTKGWFHIRKHYLNHLFPFP
jgi:hypothetical protein